MKRSSSDVEFLEERPPVKKKVKKEKNEKTVKKANDGDFSSELIHLKRKVLSIFAVAQRIHFSKKKCTLNRLRKDVKMLSNCKRVTLMDLQRVEKLFPNYCEVSPGSNGKYVFELKFPQQVTIHKVVKQFNRKMGRIKTLQALDRRITPLQVRQERKKFGTVEFDALSFTENSPFFNFYYDQIKFTKILPQREAEFGKLEFDIPADVEIALTALDIDASKLWSHQAEAINHLHRRQNVIIATSTASGKSLCYLLPVLSELNEIRSGRALFLFPTKALAQDQVGKLRSLCNALPSPLLCDTYDGDTPYSERSRITRNCHVVLSNPDMLHINILAKYQRFITFLENLRYVVIDEAHAYHGIFGSHVSLVLRRLRRICHNLGSDPKFICCSATIGNPGEHMRKLTGIDDSLIEVVKEDGSPSGKKVFVFWQPPLKKHQPSNTPEVALVYEHIGKEHSQTQRKSAFLESAQLLGELVSADLKTIAFCSVRKICELVLKYCHELMDQDVEKYKLKDLVKSYRGGYHKKERREIEQSLFQGKLRGVVSTSALELGVDVGTLDATIHVGYQGLASLWQQAGRAGRGTRNSLALFVPLDGLLDTHILAHPELVFDKKCERTIIDPHNISILDMQLICAAAEEPLCPEDDVWFGHHFLDRVAHLTNEGALTHFEGQWHLNDDWSKYLTNLMSVEIKQAHPVQALNIRSIAAKTYEVRIEGTDRIIDTEPAWNAMFHLFPGAVYLNQGKEYVVKEMDIKELKVVVSGPTKVNYYTKSSDHTNVDVICRLAQPEGGRTQLYACCHFGKVVATTTVFGYRKVAKRSMLLLETHDLKLPPIQNEGPGLWIDIPVSILDKLKELDLSFLEGCHAASHLIIGCAPLFLTCEASQLDTECPSPYQVRTRSARMIIFEKIPGGTGICEALVKTDGLLLQILRLALSRVQECNCFKGCLGCVYSTHCNEQNLVTSKRAARVILSELVALADKV